MSLKETAIRVLERAAGGASSWEEVQELARMILADPPRAVLLAQRVQEGGEFAMAAGLELAGLVLRAQCEDRAQDRDGFVSTRRVIGE